MLLRVVFTYLELLFFPALLIYGIAMIIYGIGGAAIGIIRSIPLLSLAVFVLLFLFLVVRS